MFKTLIDMAFSSRDATGPGSRYDEWSASWDGNPICAESAIPERCARALAAYAPDKSLPLLDFGCRTGLAGLAFAQAGFTKIDGIDASGEMIATSEARNVYRTLKLVETETTIEGHYPLIGAVGVIGPGAAPPSTLDLLLHAAPSGGLLVFSFNDDALADPQSNGRLNEWLDCGAARLLFAERGPHLPENDIQSTVYVVDKA